MPFPSRETTSMQAGACQREGPTDVPFVVGRGAPHITEHELLLLIEHRLELRHGDGRHPRSVRTVSAEATANSHLLTSTVSSAPTDEIPPPTRRNHHAQAESESLASAYKSREADGAAGVEDVCDILLQRSDAICVCDVTQTRPTKRDCFEASQRNLP
jgi:hypothetical protein